ncbi:ubiquinol-cytochrome c reductase iron-sulfur subunit [Alicyclobacillus tolerans]|uniref:QcrA and Rieske domain-containing protein n=1 Tax=Alicyclobacillus tolerans TaxID=90970 RepID=UPI001F3B42CC|nr:ubiquinol-cytochrome c reductase iron-sulfur subunit [Alicyclobacillus tolerans]MCF8564852.1 ubiquinol-cytochrome c reductase iron-sulfur subunit [Alicyclobacillus tolerans]
MTDHKKATSLELGNDSKGLTRRQFLTYVLGGTGAFMASTVMTPLLISSADPLHRSAGGSYAKTSWKVSDFDDKLPKHVTYLQHIDDGWNSQDKPNDVYVIKYQKKLMIMSHVCTHLGCHVKGSTHNGKSIAPEYSDGLKAGSVSYDPNIGPKSWFFCPCHGSHYDNYGVNTPNSPAPRPLDLYQYKVDSDGYVWVGPSFKRYDNNWEHNPNPEVD